MSLLRKIKNQFNFTKTPPPSAAPESRDLEILLVTAPPWGTHNPPTGLAYLSTFLNKNAIRATVFDGNIEFYRRLDPKWHQLWLPEHKNRWGSKDNFTQLCTEFSPHIDWLVERILSYHAPILGFSVVDPKERMTIEIIRRIITIDNSKRIILGGPAISTPEQRRIFLRNINDCIDYFVEGQGEAILLDIMETYKRNSFSSPKDTPIDPPLVVNKKIPDLDAIPFPTYEEFKFPLYDGGGFFVEWSRGCISSCAYCKGRHLLGPYRMKKSTHIVNELEYLVEHYGFKHFIVCDNLLNGNIGELEKLCDMLIAKQLGITWEGQAIPYRKMTLPLLQKIKQAGCTKIQWGLESGSDILLENVNKGKIFQVKDAEDVLRNSHAAGLQNEIFLIIGLPGENEEEFQKTLSFIRQNVQYIDLIKSVNTLHLVHGTDLYDKAQTTFALSLPEDNTWHYQWSSLDGNNSYTQRVDRARRLLQLADKLSIPVREHNLYEGRNPEKNTSRN